MYLAFPKESVERYRDEISRITVNIDVVSGVTYLLEFCKFHDLYFIGGEKNKKLYF